MNSTSAYGFPEANPTAHQLMKCRVVWNGQVLKSSSVFPFFNHRMQVTGFMIASRAAGRVIMLDNLALKRVRSRFRWELEFSGFEQFDPEPRQDWHFDPCWVLKHQRYANLSLDHLKATNCVDTVSHKIHSIAFDPLTLAPLHGISKRGTMIPLALPEISEPWSRPSHREWVMTAWWA